MRKISRFLGSLAMAAVLTVGSFSLVSADGTTPNYTVKLYEGTTLATNTYSAYKVASFGVATVDGLTVYTDITAVSPYDGTNSTTGKAYFDVDTVKNWTETANASDLQALANTLADVTNNAPVISGDNDGTLEFTEPGYYLIKETAHNTSDNKIATKYILVAVDGTNTDGKTITLKSSDADITKKIVLENSTNNVTGHADAGKLVDTNVAAIGDTVTYNLNAGIPEYPSYAENVIYKITDTISSGLTSATVVTVKIKTQNAGEYTTIYTSDTTDTDTLKSTNIDTSALSEDGTTVITIPWSILQNYVGGYVDVTMTAKVDTDAVVGESGNPNSANLTYSRNWDTEETYTTKPDTVITYVGKLKIEKVDGTNSDTKLSGAEFAIYTATDHDKTVPTGNITGTVPATIKIDSNDNLVTDDQTEGTTYYFYAYGTTADVTGILEVTGMDNEVCYAIEHKAPTGYNLNEGPIKIPVTVSATSPLTLEQEGNVVDETDQTTLKAANEDSENYKVTWKSGNASAQSISNTKGTTLPGTGGIGTTLFTFGGLALVFVAAVMFFGYMKRQRNQ